MECSGSLRGQWAFDGIDPYGFEIESIDLVEPSKGFDIQTENAAAWPYK